MKITEQMVEAVLALKAGGMKTRKIVATMGISSCSVEEIIRAGSIEGWTEYKKQKNEKIKQIKRNRKKSAEKTATATIKKTEERILTKDEAVYKETQALLSDLAEKFNEMVSLSVNMRDRIYIAENRIRQIYQGGE